MANQSTAQTVGNWFGQFGFIEWVYALLLIVIGISILWKLWNWLKELEFRRKQRLKRQKNFDAVATKSPVEDSLSETRKQSLQNVETRFTILRRLLFPSILLLFFLLVIIPFMQDMPKTVVSLLIAGVTVIVSIAARPFVENLICGVVITFSKHIRIGDTVLVDDRYGTVEDITLTHTTIKKWDWRRYVIPNSQMLQKAFLNYTLNDRYRWVSVEFWVGYESDLDQVKELSVEAVKRSKYYASGYEEPRFWVCELAKEGISCMVVGWVREASDGWMFSTEGRIEIAKELRKHGIRTHSFRYMWGGSGGEGAEIEGDSEGVS